MMDPQVTQVTPDACEQLLALQAWRQNSSAKPAASAATASASVQPARRTNRELLDRVRNSPDTRERDQAAAQLRRQIQGLCAAAIARRMPGMNVQDIEDLAQDVFLRLLSAPADADPTAAYIVRIATNLRIDEQRHRARRGQEKPGLSFDDPDLGLASVVADESAMVEETVVGQLQQRAVRQELNRALRPVEATILWRRAEGASHEEIAGDLGLTPVNVRKRCERGLKRLRHLADVGQLAFAP